HYSMSENGSFANVFFFQAEDGIRDRNVTGVQTCALPIFHLLQMKAQYHFYFYRSRRYASKMASCLPNITASFSLLSCVQPSKCRKPCIAKKMSSLSKE